MVPAAGMPTTRRGGVYQISEVGRPANGGADQRSGLETIPVVCAERDMAPGGFDEYRAGHKIGHRAFVLWADHDRKRLLARVATVSAAKGEPATYQIVGATGESVATIVRESAIRARWGRTRWSATLADGRTLVGYRGQTGWWVLW
jgi:hypothetical protein